jgi:hypothetical protein
MRVTSKGVSAVFVVGGVFGLACSSSDSALDDAADAGADGPLGVCTDCAEAGADGAPPHDAGPQDSGSREAASQDAARQDAGPRDAGPDAGAHDAAPDGNACTFYTTQFLGNENPISENGAWTNGGTTGKDWQNIVENSGLAYGSGFSAGYNDCIAHLSCFPANQWAQATVHLAAGYSPGGSHEIELLLRFEIAAHAARGYEINVAWNGGYSQIVRWNGALNDFTVLSPSGPGFGPPANGDVIKATAVGSTITVYKNGTQVMQVVDATWSDGNPGMGMFVRPDPTAVLQNYGFSDYSAGAL